MNFRNRQGDAIDRTTWAHLMEDDSYRVVRQTKFSDGSMVSTVWLGLDHGLGGPVPLFFETMTFPGQEFCGRHSTEFKALAAHLDTVAEYQAKHPNAEIEP